MGFTTILKKIPYEFREHMKLRKILTDIKRDRNNLQLSVGLIYQINKGTDQCQQ